MNAALRLLILAAVALAAHADVVDVAVPSASGSSEPHLFTDARGGLLLSWVEPASAGGAVRVARYDGKSWSAPSTVYAGANLLLNSADIPSVIAEGDGTLFAQWLTKGGGHHASDVWYAVSADGGKKWTAPALLNRDGKQAEHGFASPVPLPGGGIGVVWLDGRGGDMMLRYAEIDRRGTMARETMLDARVCDCCATGMVMTPSGPVIAYRDRDAKETRDVSVIRGGRGGWSVPAALHADGWKIKACPVNGPQLDARGDSVAAAWYTAANEQARVYAAFSRDGGKSFGAPLRIDGGSAGGRVDVLALPGDAALVVWIEGTTIAARRTAADGKLGPIVKLGEVSNARGAGLPRAALVGSTAYVAWTEPGTTKRIRVVRFDAH